MKRRRIWVTRDVNDEVEVWSKLPTKTANGFFCGERGTSIAEMMGDVIRQLAPNACPFKPGQCIEFCEVAPRRKNLEGTPQHPLYRAAQQVAPKETEGGEKVKCQCPIYCRYCGRRRSKDSTGHYCKTNNCQWQYGYSTCPVFSEELEKGDIEFIEAPKKRKAKRGAKK